MPTADRYFFLFNGNAKDSVGVPLENNGGGLDTNKSLHHPYHLVSHLQTKRMSSSLEIDIGKYRFISH